MLRSPHGRVGRLPAWPKPAIFLALLSIVCGASRAFAQSAMPAGGANTAAVWVATDGDDRQAGSRERPVATVAEAQRRLRTLRRASGAPRGGTHIILRGGVYRLAAPLVFRAEDSGSEASPTVIEAAPGERPVLSGGIALAHWRRPEGALAGLSPSARQHVWVADAPIRDGRVVELRQLWVDGRKATRARTPNGDVMERLIAWDREREEAAIAASLVAAISDPSGSEVVLQQQWEIAILRVKALRLEGEQARLTFQQPESRIEFAHPWPQPTLAPLGQAAFFLTGAIEFLDQPGEWHQELPSGRIMYWPRDGEDMSRVEAVVPALETLVEVAGTLDRPVAHLRFQGIAFEHTTWMRPSRAGHVPLQAGMYLREAYELKPLGTPHAPTLDNQAWVGRPPAGVSVGRAHHVRFERCRFEHMAMTGLDCVGGTHDDAIEGCVFRDIGGNGIQLGSFQDGDVETHVPYQPADEREICTRERIANNVLRDCANEDWGGVGICVGYARATTIEHNDVADVSYTGISVGWGWTSLPNAMRGNRVHANRLSRVATRMCDTAGIYLLSAQPGTIVSENSIGTITMSPYVDRPEHWFYLYTDEGSSFITLRDNWCPAEKFLQNANGPGNRWERNGPTVPRAVAAAAGLESAFRDLLTALGATR